MEIYIGGRGAGKTTKCIEFLEANPDAIVLASSHTQRQCYPKHLKDRVIVSEIEIVGVHSSNIAIDDLDMFNIQTLKIMLWQISTTKDGLKLITATPFYSWNQYNTILRTFIRENKGYTLLPPTTATLSNISQLAKSLTHEIFWVHIYGYMKTDEELLKDQDRNQKLSHIVSEIERLYEEFQ